MATHIVPSKSSRRMVRAIVERDYVAVNPLLAKGSGRPSSRASKEGQKTIAILIPCYNEELTIAGVVHQFRVQLPEADIYVFDNNSTDRTVERARRAGALVFYEKRQGKGYVVQSMFREVDADVYIIVDGDGTYPSSEVYKLIEPILRGEADMTVGSRFHEESESQLKSVNRFGNRLFLWVLNTTFKVRVTDMLSG
jgi:glycosyltransferase involved in cell wall biosynthesis